MKNLLCISNECMKDFDLTFRNHFFVGLCQYNKVLCRFLSPTLNQCKNELCVDEWVGLKHLEEAVFRCCVSTAERKTVSGLAVGSWTLSSQGQQHLTIACTRATTTSLFGLSLKLCLMLQVCWKKEYCVFKHIFFSSCHICFNSSMN